MTKIEEAIKNIATIDYALIEKTQTRLDNLTKPTGSLGRLEEIAKIIVGITGIHNPELKDKVVFTLAADHGVTEEGVSAYPKEVTAQMVYNFLKQGAGINVLAKHAGARVIVADFGVCVDLEAHPGLIVKKINYGTKNMTKGPAMSRSEAINAIEAGIDLFETEYKKGINILGVGEMGIGNTAAASAITAVITNKAIEEVTGKGAGINDKALKNKIRVIKEAIKINQPKSADAIDVLSKVGGFEIAGLSGIILAAAVKKIPVVIDGFISGSAALAAYHITPKVKEYMIASHCSAEKGHRIILDYIGLKPILDLGLRLGEGTGSALAMNIIEASVRILTQMATFKSANVSERKKS